MESLLTKKQQLIETRRQLNNQLDKIREDIIKTQYNISKQCKKDNNGHKWVNEREEGPYGERFCYCSICGIDSNGDYFHF